MPTKKISRNSEPDGAVFLTAPQVCQRYANRVAYVDRKDAAKETRLFRRPLEVWPSALFQDR